MTINFLDRLHTKKLQSKTMTRAWMRRFSKIINKLKRGAL